MSPGTTGTADTARTAAETAGSTKTTAVGGDRVVDGVGGTTVDSRGAPTDLHSANQKEHLMGIVVIGGLIDSVLGIVNGAVVAITSAASAVVLPLLPI